MKFGQERKRERKENEGRHGRRVGTRSMLVRGVKIFVRIDSHSSDPERKYSYDVLMEFSHEAAYYLSYDLASRMPTTRTDFSPHRHPRSPHGSPLQPG